jgi:hypothetical protein
MKKRDVFFLSMCLLWPVCGMLADHYQTDRLLGMFFLFAMIIAGICAGLDLFLAPQTNLFYRIAKESHLPFVYPVTARLIGLLLLVGNLGIGWQELRHLLGYVP